MSKRGISPLIATVLILGFTIVLGVVVYSFVNSTVREGIMDSETRAELGSLCLGSNVEYDVQCHLGPYLRLRANNNGLEDVQGVLVNIERDGGSDVLASNVSLGPYGGKIFYAMFEGVVEDIEKVKLSPRFVLNNNTYDCNGFVEIDPKDIPMCDNYVENNKGESLRSPFNPASYGWDISLHNDAVWPEIWSLGWNSGVVDPANGYHAKWVQGEGFENGVGIIMNDANCAIGQCNRWLGINQNIASNIATDLPDWNNGDNITISFYAKASDAVKQYQSGMYHTQSGTPTFGGTLQLISPSDANKWDIEYLTFIYDSSVWDATSYARVYLYGHHPMSAEGIVWYDNIQVFKTPTII